MLDDETMMMILETKDRNEKWNDPGTQPIRRDHCQTNTGVPIMPYASNEAVVVAAAGAKDGAAAANSVSVAGDGPVDDTAALAGPATAELPRP